MILIISSGEDDHTRIVMQKLEKDGIKARLLDLSLFPQRLSLSMDYSDKRGCKSHFVGEGDDIQLSDYSVVWWRRPQPFQLDKELKDPININFAYNECYSAISGLWLTLGVDWINNPTRDDEAARKPYQLKVARDVGFQIPRTLITNNPDDAREFTEELGVDKTIYKAFTGMEEAWRETRLLKNDEVSLLDNVRLAPVIFQEYIPLQLDLRITVIGREIFTSAIYPNEDSYKVDYRMDLNSLKVESFNLPKDVTNHIYSLMEKLGLLYGAIDMRLTPNNQYIFLEINPSGQWLFMEYRTGLPMTDAFIHLLTEYRS